MCTLLYNFVQSTMYNCVPVFGMVQALVWYTIKELWKERVQLEWIESGLSGKVKNWT